MSSSSDEQPPRTDRERQDIPRSPRDRNKMPPDETVLPGMERRSVVKGTKPGSTYIRRQLPSSQEFRPRGADVLEATERALEPRTRAGIVGERIKRLLIGERIPTAQQAQERLTKVKALAVLSSDAISSVAYATEASLGILIAAGVSALQYNLVIAALVALLMVIVGISYRQTIHAYPQGGGSYIVARDNLGTLPGLVAAAALLIDYILTVAVSVSAGVDALLSAVTSLHAYSVELGVLFIAIIMLINLRGIRESGTIFAAPTYLFVVSFLIMIGAGIVKAALAPGGLGTPIPATTPPEQLGWQPQQLGILLILTAFASGCSAMTGVEAISDGVPAFKAPESRNAARTLTWMIAILMSLFLGITYLAWRFGIEPNAQQVPTVDAQIATQVFTGPFAWFFYVIQIVTLLILVLAANTSFADFPRLSSFLARDQFLPHLFAFRGDRLAFSTGIIALAVLSGGLLAIFRGQTDALINLYALGVFAAFTLSQTGMVFRWRRLRDAGGPAWRRSLAINAVGATATAVVTVVIGVTKFERGAWIVVLLVPLLVLMFRGISRHYASVTRNTITPTPLVAADIQHIAIVPIPDLNRQVVQSLAYAYSLTSRVVAVHISVNPDETSKLRASWSAWVETRRASWAAVEEARGMATEPEGVAETPARAERPRPAGPQLVIIDSPYRSLVAPLVAYIDAVRDQNPAATVSVILPEFVPAHWWERLLHNQTALRLKLALYSHPGVVVVNVPYHLPRT